MEMGIETGIGMGGKGGERETWERSRCSYWLGATNALALRGAAIWTTRRDSSEKGGSGAGNRNRNLLTMTIRSPRMQELRVLEESGAGCER